MGETAFKLILWTIPWLLLISVIGYGLYQSDGDFEHFMTGNMPTVLKEFSEIKVSKDIFGLKKIDVAGKSIIAQFYFNSPFPFPVKIKEILIQGESQSSNTKFEMKLEKEVLIQPHENSTLTLKGDLPSSLENAEFKLKNARITMEILGLIIEVQEGRK